MVVGSLLLKPLFIFTVCVGTLLTAVAMFTPGWRQFYNSKGDLTQISVGIITDSCGSEQSGNLASCGDWFSSQPGWEKAVIVLLMLALATELIIVVWAVLSCFAFCLPSLFYPLPFLTGAAATFLVVAVSIYGANNGHQISVPASAGQFNTQSNVGYSFWMGVAASVAMILATFLGCVTAAVGGI